MKINTHVTELLLITLFIQNLNGFLQNRFGSGTLSSMNKINPELGLNTTQIIDLYNFTFEEHTISTQDKYFIKIQRVISKNITKFPKYPVLMMHGLNCYSAIWVDNCNASLAFILSNHGYDVWLGNIRGNPYGMSSEKNSSKEFWNFSFHEHGVQDLPSIIDFILTKTGFHQLFYIGHSMGTTMMFVLLSSIPEYNAKIKSFMALAPVTYITHILPKFQTVLDNFNFIKGLLSYVNQYALVPTPEMHSLFLNLFCRNEEQQKCENFIFTIAGNSTTLLNKTRIPLYISHASIGTSLNTIEHYLQIRKSHNFSQYDYGNAKDNIKHYGNVIPPAYNLTKVSAPVALFWSEGDYLADPSDVARLRAQLANVILDYEIPYKNFTHVDFLWANNSKELLYDKMIQVMDKLIKLPVKDRP